ncbi:hypothetical protein R1flu_004762 [Riccia fluitans]|uniref:Uncharacterized protein n=1 Tax=Riccia fluitans TaxID=41844 RepID=A0ABD1YRJ0_9MARC
MRNNVTIPLMESYKTLLAEEPQYKLASHQPSSACPSSSTKFHTSLRRLESKRLTVSWELVFCILSIKEAHS